MYFIFYFWNKLKCENFDCTTVFKKPYYPYNKITKKINDFNPKLFITARPAA